MSVTVVSIQDRCEQFHPPESHFLISISVRLARLFLYYYFFIPLCTFLILFILNSFSLVLLQVFNRTYFVQLFDISLVLVPHITNYHMRWSCAVAIHPFRLHLYHKTGQGHVSFVSFHSIAEYMCESSPLQVEYISFQNLGFHSSGPALVSELHFLYAQNIFKILTI